MQPCKTLAKDLMQQSAKSFVMDVDNEYDISIRFKGASHSFRIRAVPIDGRRQYLVLNIDDTIEADVWQKYDLYFTLDAAGNDARSPLKLSPEYEGRIDPGLVSEISDIIRNAEQD